MLWALSVNSLRQFSKRKTVNQAGVFAKMRGNFTVKKAVALLLIHYDKCFLHSTSNHARVFHCGLGGKAPKPSRCC